MAQKAGVRWYLRLLVLGLIATWAGFLVENGMMLWSSREVRGETHGLSTNALPSIEALTNVRNDLYRVSSCVGSGGRVEVCLDAERPKLEQHIERYASLPFYPGEEQRFAEASATLQSLLRTPNRPALDRAHDLLGDLVVLNARHAAEHAATISDRRSASTVLELLLDVSVVLIATVLTAIAFLAIKRYTRFLEEEAAELDSFASRVAHDVLSPLASVGMAVELERRRHPDDANTQRSTERALSALRRVRALVDDLLDFARAGAQGKGGESSDVSALMCELRPELAQQADEAAIEMEMSLPAEKCLAACAPGVLTSILTNLVRNAIKYMGAAERRHVEIRVEPRGRVVRFEVTDSGPGIAPELHEYIFEPYARVPGSGKGGLGIGLATVKRLVVAHLGAVGVRSQLGAGATFWFELPRADALGERQPVPPPAA
jgi:signal transduction histidine kinase